MTILIHKQLQNTTGLKHKLQIMSQI